MGAPPLHGVQLAAHTCGLSVAPLTAIVENPATRLGDVTPRGDYPGTGPASR